MKTGLWILILLLLASLVLLGLSGIWSPFERIREPSAGESAEGVPEVGEAARMGSRGLLFGRVTTRAGRTYEGRLRWGGDEEAFWHHYFTGIRKENPWAVYVPFEWLEKERPPIAIFGFELLRREPTIDLERPVMLRFGDIGRLEAKGTEIHVTRRNGEVIVLDRFSTSDFDDGVRVWDESRGVVDLDSWQIHTVELRQGPPDAFGSAPLHGTVQTRIGEFTGFVRWNRQDGLGSDELQGQSDGGSVRLRFDTIRSIARSGDHVVVALEDGRALEIWGSQEVGRGNRGVYVDDPRYGRVLVPWRAFERVEFFPGPVPRSSGELPPGEPLKGCVEISNGRHLTGRLVFDLDESQTSDTFDARSRGIGYTIPFGRIASIRLHSRNDLGGRHALVTFHSGEVLALEPTGDLAEENAGLLVFVEDEEGPELVPWSDVEQIDFERGESAAP